MAKRGIHELMKYTSIVVSFCRPAYIEAGGYIFIKSLQGMSLVHQNLLAVI